MTNLALCLSQEENKIPYMFSLTGVRVFALEEAVFYVFHNWRETGEEIKDERFIEWVQNTLRLEKIARRLEDAAVLPKQSDYLSEFLRCAEIFEPGEINKILRESDAWEQRLNWERMKERGDYFMRGGSPGKALAFYKSALAEKRNAPLLNNAAVALMRMGNFDEAARLLNEAQTAEPDNSDIALHYAEACVYAGRWDEARQALGDSKNQIRAAKIYGELTLRQGDRIEAEKYFIRAAADETAESIIRLADFYIDGKEYAKAEEALDRLPKSASADEKRSELYESQGRYAEAAQLMEKSLKATPHDVSLWIRLAEINRTGGRLESALEAASRALELDGSNPYARLEIIKARRAMSRSREYLAELKILIRYLKESYRETGLPVFQIVSSIHS